MQNWKKVCNNIFILIVLVVLGLLMYSLHKGQVPNVAGYHIFRVVSQSMAPKIPDETCIIVKDVDTNTLKEEDIITFVSTDPDIYGYFNTHRIYAINRDEQGNAVEFVTKGDSNDLPDEQTVSPDHIIGRYVREMPFGMALAKLMNLLSDTKVYFICIMLPLMISLMVYIWQLIGVITSTEEELEEKEMAQQQEQIVLEDEDKEEIKEELIKKVHEEIGIDMTKVHVTEEVEDEKQVEQAQKVEEELEVESEIKSDKTEDEERHPDNTR